MRARACVSLWVPGLDVCFGVRGRCDGFSFNVGVGVTVFVGVWTLRFGL